MFVSVCKSIIRRSVEYQRRGLKVLRHGVILILGLGIASFILIVSGHNPFIPEAVSANWISDGILEVVTSPLSIATAINAIIGGVLVSIFGLLMVFFMFLTVQMASYDVVINTPNVVVAWKVLRDIVNLFFVIILLIIAIGTTLRREQYMWNKNLPRFIIAVIFVNFSRTIVAFVTDFADVVQQTFVAGISTVGLANLVASFGLPFFTSFTSGIGASVQDKLTQPVAIAAAGGIVVVLELIVCAIMFVYFVLFLGRVILLWLIAVFGPVAFAASILPQTQKYYKDWWSKLSQAAILGPMLAFFIWLAITLVPDPTTASLSLGSLTGAPPIPGAAAEPSFLVGVLMMVIILYFGMQQGMGMAGDFGSFVGKAQSFAFGTVLGGLGSAAAFAGKDVLGRLDYGQMKARQAIGRGIQSNFKGGIGQTIGGLVGAGGTFGNLRQAFLERQQEGAKRRSESGLEANKALATTVGTWPVLKAVELVQGRKGAVGDVQEKAGGGFKTALDNLQDSTEPIAKRQENARKEINAALEKARADRAAGKISQGDLTEVESLANEHLAVVDSAAWAPQADLDTNQTNLNNLRNQSKSLDDSIVEREGKIRELDSQYTAQEAIYTDPASTPAQQAAAATEMTRLENERLTERAGLQTDRDTKNALPSEIARLEGVVENLKVTVEADPAIAALKTTADTLRGKDSDLINKGQAASTGAWLPVIGQALVNLGQEYGTQRYIDQKGRWDSGTKEAERQTGLDKDNLVDYLVKANSAGDANKIQSALMGLAKKGKLSSVTSNYRALPAVEKLFSDDLKSKGASDDEIKKFIEEFRKSPGDKGYQDTALELMLKKAYNGDKSMVGMVMGNIRDADHEASGATTASTYTDPVTGSTTLIEMKVAKEGGEWKVTYDDKALKALNSELKGMKPGEFMYNLKKANLFKSDADGNIQGISSLFKNYMKALPANFAAHVKNMNASTIQAIKENQRMMEEQISANPTAKEWQNMKKIMTEMKGRGML